MKIKHIIYAGTIHVLLFLFVFYIVNQSFGKTALFPKGAISPSFAKLILPQGWNFFTKSPSDLYNLYKLNGHEFIEVIPPNNSFKNFFFGRKSRKKGAELYSIVEVFDNNKWTDITGGIKSNKDYCLTLPTHKYEKNKYVKLLDTGTYYIEQTNTIPWNWVANIKLEKVPSKIIKIELHI